MSVRNTDGRSYADIRVFANFVAKILTPPHAGISVEIYDIVDGVHVWKLTATVPSLRAGRQFVAEVGKIDRDLTPNNLSKALLAACRKYPK
jgi:hypothetical protein